MIEKIEKYKKFLIERYGSEVENYLKNLPENLLESDDYYDFLKKSGFAEITIYLDCRSKYNTNSRGYLIKITKEKIVSSKGKYLTSTCISNKNYESWTPGSLRAYDDYIMYVLFLPNEPAELIIYSYYREEWKQIEIEEKEITVIWDGKQLEFKSRKI